MAPPSSVQSATSAATSTAASAQSQADSDVFPLPPATAATIFDAPVPSAIASIPQSPSPTRRRRFNETILCADGSVVPTRSTITETAPTVSRYDQENGQTAIAESLHSTHRSALTCTNCSDANRAPGTINKDVASNKRRFKCATCKKTWSVNQFITAFFHIDSPIAESTSSSVSSSAISTTRTSASARSPTSASTSASAARSASTSASAARLAATSASAARSAAASASHTAVVSAVRTASTSTIPSAAASPKANAPYATILPSPPTAQSFARNPLQPVTHSASLPPSLSQPFTTLPSFQHLPAPFQIQSPLPPPPPFAVQHHQEAVVDGQDPEKDRVPPEAFRPTGVPCAFGQQDLLANASGQAQPQYPSHGESDHLRQIRELLSSPVFFAASKEIKDTILGSLMGTLLPARSITAPACLPQAPLALQRDPNNIGCSSASLCMLADAPVVANNHKLFISMQASYSAPLLPALSSAGSIAMTKRGLDIEKTLDAIRVKGKNRKIRRKALQTLTPYPIPEWTDLARIQLGCGNVDLAGGITAINSLGLDPRMITYVLKIGHGIEVLVPSWFEDAIRSKASLNRLPIGSPIDLVPATRELCNMVLKAITPGASSVRTPAPAKLYLEQWILRIKANMPASRPKPSSHAATSPASFLPSGSGYPSSFAMESLAATSVPLELLNVILLLSQWT
jgi:hypothetical protein